MASRRTFNVSINGNAYSIDIQKLSDGQATVEVNGATYTVEFESNRPVSKTPTLVRSVAYNTEGERTMKTARPEENKGRVIKSPLPGIILTVNVKEGDAVKAGDLLLVMEAMKMENNIVSPADGKVSHIKVKQGMNVLEGEVLVEIGG